MSVTEAQLWQFVSTIFAKYDWNNSGSLDSNELVSFFNDIFAQCGSPTRVNLAQAQ
jgi:Ca2+-binding EF-hand superfamily protein